MVDRTEEDILQDQRIAELQNKVAHLSAQVDEMANRLREHGEAIDAWNNKPAIDDDLISRVNALHHFVEKLRATLPEHWRRLLDE